MSKAPQSKRAPAFDLFGWFGRASQRVVQAMRSFVSCTSLGSDDNFSEYLARILGDPNAMGSQNSREESPSCYVAREVCSSCKPEDSFAQYFANALTDANPVCIREAEARTPSIGSMPLKACSSSKSDDSFAQYLANAIREHNTLDFRDSRHKTLIPCSVPQEACSSSKSDARHAKDSQEVTPLGYLTPPDVWSNRNDGRSPIGFVGKLDANTSTRLVAICKSQKSQIFEGPKRITEGSNSIITSSYVKIDQCQCIGENMISTISSAQPKLPANFFGMSTRLRLRAVKQVKKLRPLSGLMATAKLIIYQPEPIKCAEAVFIALYLTAGLQSVERIPLGFKTQFANQVFQHVVLLVQYNGKYGAFGISRSPDLMNKDICYESMSSIIEDFKTAYEESDHTIVNLQIGLPVEHNIMSANFVCWEHLCLYPAIQPWPECVVEIENHASRMKHLWNLWVISGRGDDPTRKPLKCRRKAPLNDGSIKKVKPTKRKLAPTLCKSPGYKKQFDICRQAITTSAPSRSTTNLKSQCLQYSFEQQPPIPSDKTSANKSLLKGFFDPRESAGPWKYTQCAKHYDQVIMCSSLHGNDDCTQTNTLSDYGLLEQNPWEVCKHCDNCRSLLCKADSKLLSPDNPKGRGSGPLYNMVLKRSRAG